MGERLFHTLDPTTRAFRHEGRDYLVTDTVGFIRKLPHQLVEAFKATLEETVNADLILHVADASVPEEELEEMMRAVDEVLDEIGAGDKPSLLVLNKVDELDDDERRRWPPRHRDAVLVSALTGEGIEELRRADRARVPRAARARRAAGALRRAARSCRSCTRWRATSSARTRAKEYA